MDTFNQPVYCELVTMSPYNPPLEAQYASPLPQNDQLVATNYYPFSPATALLHPAFPDHEPSSIVAAFPVFVMNVSDSEAHPSTSSQEPVPVTDQPIEPLDEEVEGPPVLHPFGVYPRIMNDSFFDETIIIEAGPVYDNEVVISSTEQSEVTDEPMAAEEPPEEPEVSHFNFRSGAKRKHSITSNRPMRTVVDDVAESIEQTDEEEGDEEEEEEEEEGEEVVPEEPRLQIEPDNQQCIQSSFGCTYDISLMGSWKWQRLHELGNEMKCSMRGLTISPELGFKVSGVVAESQYRLGIRLVRQTFGINKTGRPVPIISDEIKSNIVSGKVIMEKGIRMKELKIYNEDPEDPGWINRWNMFQVVPDYSYLPYVTLYKVSRAGVARILVSSVKFPETEFMVVTRYTNPQLSKLAIGIEEHETRILEEKRLARLEASRIARATCQTVPESSSQRAEGDSSRRSPSIEIIAVVPRKRTIHAVQRSIGRPQDEAPQEKRSHRSPSLEIISVKPAAVKPPADSEVICLPSSNNSPIRICLENATEWREFRKKSGKMKCSEEGTLMDPILKYKFFELSSRTRYKLGIKLAACSADKQDSNEVFSRKTSGKKLLRDGVELKTLRIFHGDSENKIKNGIKKKQLQVVPGVRYIPSLTLYKVTPAGKMQVDVSDVTFKQTRFSVEIELEKGCQIGRRTNPKRNATRQICRKGCPL